MRFLLRIFRFRPGILLAGSIVFLFPTKVFSFPTKDTLFPTKDISFPTKDIFGLDHSLFVSD